jgi:hypothetical protein
MEEFLGKDSFLGPCIDTSSPTFVGQADFNGCIAFCNWSREDVARVLPAELELAVNTSATPELHPLVLIFGEHTQGATIFGGVTFPTGVRYHEFGMAVPFVKHRRGRHLHTFVPFMCSSFFPATWAGNVHYGFSKAMATMWWEGALFIMTKPDGALLLHAAVEPAGDWVPGAHCDLPNFAGMRSIFAMPVLGRKQDGTYVQSYFGWDYSMASVRSMWASVSTETTLIQGLAQRTCTSLRSATFEVQRMTWRLSWPESYRF